jgi:flavorubredoxin
MRGYILKEYILRGCDHMSDILVVYDSRTGNTEAAANAVAEGVRKMGASVEVKKVGDVTEDDLKAAKGIALGSYCIHDDYSGGMREFLDKKVSQVRLFGKFGAVFGTHKWNGGNVPKLEKEMLRRELALVAPGVNALKQPDDADAQRLRGLGEMLGQAALGKISTYAR